MADPRVFICIVHELIGKLTDGRRLFMTRHGQATSTTTGIFNTKIPDGFPLTEKGRTDVLSSCQKFSAEYNRLPDRVVASPFERTIETGHLWGLPLMTDSRFREPYIGAKDGTAFDLKVVFAFNYAHATDPEKSVDDCETFSSVAHRVIEGLCDLVRNMRPGEWVLISTHWHICQLMQNIIQGIYFGNVHAIKEAEVFEIMFPAKAPWGRTLVPMPHAIHQIKKPETMTKDEFEKELHHFCSSYPFVSVNGYWMSDNATYIIELTRRRADYPVISVTENQKILAHLQYIGCDVQQIAPREKHTVLGLNKGNTHIKTMSFEAAVAFFGQDATVQRIEIFTVDILRPNDPMYKEDGILVTFLNQRVEAKVHEFSRIADYDRWTIVFPESLGDFSVTFEKTTV